MPLFAKFKKSSSSFLRKRPTIPSPSYLAGRIRSGSEKLEVFDLPPCDDEEYRRKSLSDSFSGEEKMEPFLLQDAKYPFTESPPVMKTFDESPLANREPLLPPSPLSIPVRPSLNSLADQSMSLTSSRYASTSTDATSLPPSPLLEKFARQFSEDDGEEHEWSDVWEDGAEGETIHQIIEEPERLPVEVRNEVSEKMEKAEADISQDSESGGEIEERMLQEENVLTASEKQEALESLMLFPGHFSHIVIGKPTPLHFSHFLLSLFIHSISSFLSHYYSALILPTLALLQIFTAMFQRRSNSQPTSPTYDSLFSRLIYFVNDIQNIVTHSGVSISALAGLAINLMIIGGMIGYEYAHWRFGFVSGWNAVREAGELLVLGCFIGTVAEKMIA